MGGWLGGRMVANINADGFVWQKVKTVAWAANEWKVGVSGKLRSSNVCMENTVPSHISERCSHANTTRRFSSFRRCRSTTTSMRMQLGHA